MARGVRSGSFVTDDVGPVALATEKIVFPRLLAGGVRVRSAALLPDRAGSSRLSDGEIGFAGLLPGGIEGICSVDCEMG